MLHIYFRFHEIPVSVYLVMVYFIVFGQFKGNYSCITEASLGKLDVHQSIIMIHIYFQFHEILFSGNQVMAPDGLTKRRMDGHGRLRRG